MEDGDQRERADQQDDHGAGRGLPPQKLNDSSSPISWQATTGPRAQERGPEQPAGAAPRPAPRRRKNSAVVTASATRDVEHDQLQHGQGDQHQPLQPHQHRCPHQRRGRGGPRSRTAPSLRRHWGSGRTDFVVSAAVIHETRECPCVTVKFSARWRGTGWSCCHVVPAAVPSSGTPTGAQTTPPRYARDFPERRKAQPWIGAIAPHASTRTRNCSSRSATPVRPSSRSRRPSSLRRCEVREQCLAWALEAGQDHGVWGGLSEDERRALKRRNARARVRTA